MSEMLTVFLPLQKQTSAAFEMPSYKLPDIYFFCKLSAYSEYKFIIIDSLVCFRSTRSANSYCVCMCANRLSYDYRKYQIPSLSANVLRGDVSIFVFLNNHSTSEQVNRSQYLCSIKIAASLLFADILSLYI